jgi:hypothetical protein
MVNSLLGATWILFAASLCFPALYASLGDRTDSIYGFALLLVGWMGFGSLSNIAWFANPLFVAATRSFIGKRYRMSFFLGSLSLAFALTTLLKRKIEKNEAGHEWDIDQFGPGFYLWLSSIALLFMLTAVKWWAQRRGQVRSPVP